MLNIRYSGDLKRVMRTVVVENTPKNAAVDWKGIARPTLARVCAPYRATRLLREAVVVLQGLSEAALEQLLQGGPRQSVSAHPVHLHAQLEEQRLHEPRRLQETQELNARARNGGLPVRRGGEGRGGERCTDLNWKTDFGRDAAASFGLFLDLQVLPVRGRGQDSTGRLGPQRRTKLVQQHLH